MYTSIQVFPRKKSGQDEKNKPFYISTLDLTRMFHMTLHNAAEHLGISLTAMKNTCKKLGVKWPNKRERSRIQEERNEGLEGIFAGSSRGIGAARSEEGMGAGGNQDLANEHQRTGRTLLSAASNDMDGMGMMVGPLPAHGHAQVARSSGERLHHGAAPGLRMTAGPADEAAGPQHLTDVHESEDSWSWNSEPEAEEGDSPDPTNVFLVQGVPSEKKAHEP
ncbi:hypothetical protein GUITHDRAFT_121769 [Guillardia theta CCMP2712]|uniref:RWP-RK domain-containing protein n=1 Tax=Guillardia theta (strain CCMP2712) TaxID=905079 RepID=L1I838_GUITC|nr:hypothetical protein GUITHDRAFT_121769 [Guillardia theta CCMP2712]EKX32069.1 hypothetical protein GUITHDRAFT_121769 [Guillardia theta CCMP2712]|eukprot:XP_005819049.1 hypothetical protein GUITHDRAFT_121769 [Guillardia theta CCMP2712]